MASPSSLGLQPRASEHLVGAALPRHVLGTRSLNAGVLLPGAAWEGSAGAIGLGFIPQNSWSRCGYHGLL